MTTSTLDSSLVQEIRPLEDLRWEDLVARHPRSSIFHTTAWLKALQRTYGYQPVVVTKANSGERLTNGLVFCKVQSWLTGPRWVSLPFSDHCAPLTDGSQYLEACLSEIQCAVGREHLRYVELRPGPDFEGIGSVMCSGAWRPARSYCLSHLDLTPNLDTLFRKCHKDSTQRKICRARREQLRYEEGRAPALLDAFYRLLILTRKRHGLPPQPKQWFQNLAECFGPALKIRVASQGHRPVAAIVTIRHKDTLVYKYGCSDAAYNNLGGMHLLFWEAIEEGNREGMSTFDLGRSDIGNQGLITFKDRWGARRSHLQYYVRGPSSRAQTTTMATGEKWTEQAAKRICSRLPHPALCLVGQLLYRHIG